MSAQPLAPRSSAHTTLPRNVAWLGLGILILWCLLQWFVRRPHHIVDDAAAWRGADTQTIARFYWRDGIELLHPRIAWGGDGPGYVEAELQLYPALVALLMRLVGYAEWPGQLVSLVSMALAHVVLFRTLARQFSPWPALLASILLLSGKGTTLISTGVQPDALAFLLAVIGWDAFSQYVDEPTRRTLLVAAGATGVAALIKPTMLALGMAQFVLVVLSRPALLRRFALWLAWAAVLLVLTGYLVHARRLFLTYGNTFGILSGGDSKLPHLKQLLDPALWLAALKNNVIWGTGVPAVLAGFWLVLHRRVQAAAWALLAADLAMIAVALRYTSNVGWGVHYNLVAIPLGAHVLAHAFHDFTLRFDSPAKVPPTKLWAWLGGAVAIFAGLQYSHAAYRVRSIPPEPEAALGRRLAMIASPGDLIVVRARSFSYDQEWNTANNFQDPRVFYLSDTRGWVVANDQPEVRAVERHLASGAKYYVEPYDKWHSYPALSDWLHSHASLLLRTEEGTIWDLQPAHSGAGEQK